MTGLERSIALLVFRVAASIALVIAAVFVIWRRPIAPAFAAVRRDFAMLPRPRFSLPLAIITLFGALFRILDLQRPMGSDESATFLYYASKPVLLALTIYGSPNNHLLHTALMHASSCVFGDAEWALRLPAFLAGVAMIPLTYCVAAAVSVANGRPRAGAPTLAAALTASWPALIDYSNDGRGYTLLCCFTLIAAASMCYVIRGGNSAAVLLFAIACALGFYTVPVMLYPFVMLVVWGLTSLHRRQVAIAAIGAILLTAIVYAPVIVISGPRALLSNPYVQPMPLGEFVRALPAYAIAVWKSMTVAVPWIIQAMSAVAVLRKRVAQAILPAIAAVAIVLALQRVLPFPRVWLPLLPLLFACVAIGRLRPAATLAIAFAVCISLGVIAVGRPRLHDTGELPAVFAIVRELEHRARPGDAILALPPSEMPLAFYAPNLRAEILNPDWHHARRIFVVENRAYGQTLAKTLAFFQISGNRRLIRDFGSSALYEVWRSASLLQHRAPALLDIEASAAQRLSQQATHGVDAQGHLFQLGELTNGERFPLGHLESAEELLHLVQRESELLGVRDHCQPRERIVLKDPTPGPTRGWRQQANALVVPHRRRLDAGPPCKFTDCHHDSLLT